MNRSLDWMKHGSLALLTLASSLLPIAAQAIPETDYDQAYQTLILPFLDSGERFTFAAHDGIPLSGVKFIRPDAKATIVYLSGRTGAWIRDGEIFYDLYQAGFNVFVYDHRGQGFSPRLVAKNPQIGHVAWFSDYAQDLNRFVETVVRPQAPQGQKLFLLAHSMGAAIATDYLTSYVHPFASVILSAPMYQVDTRPYPEPIAAAIVNSAVAFGQGKKYAAGQTDFDFNTPFQGNTLTTSPARYAAFQDMSRRFPDAVLGGASNRWVQQALRGSRRIRNSVARLNIPMILLQAGNDRIVKPKGQIDGCKKSPLCTLISIPGAEHELLNERDELRNLVFGIVFATFQ